MSLLHSVHFHSCSDLLFLDVFRVVMRGSIFRRAIYIVLPVFASADKGDYAVCWLYYHREVQR